MFVTDDTCLIFALRNYRDTRLRLVVVEVAVWVVDVIDVLMWGSINVSMLRPHNGWEWWGFDLFKARPVRIGCL